MNHWQILDVGSPDSFVAIHISSARNNSLDNLRGNLAFIDKQQFIVVYSRVGYHGYLAYRVLKQFGYDVANLDGGLELLIEEGSGAHLLSHGGS